MAFEIVEKDLMARIGRLYTKSGTIETPCLFPVVNPVKQVVGVNDIERIGFRQLMMNAYLIKRGYGDVAKKVKLHGLIGWSHPIMTDSGAYQLMEYGEVDVDPDSILEYEVEIGSDIVVILDVPTQAESPKHIVITEVEETIRRARRALVLLKELDPDHKILSVGPVQGGPNLDVLTYSAYKMSALDFDVYAIGSPTTLLERYDFKSIIDMIVCVKSIVPPGKPIHLFGLGHPLIMPFAVALGVDTFDSASYAVYARDDRLMLRDGTVRLSDLECDYVPCACPVCSKYSVREMREMSSDEREPLIAAHNLYVLHREIEDIKQRIREGTLWDYLEEKASSNPRLYEAFIELRRARKLLLRFSPVTRGRVHGISVISRHSTCRPEIMRYKDRLISSYIPPEKDVLLVLPEPDERPYVRSLMYREVVKRLSQLNLVERVHVCFFNAVFGIVPHELCELYPLSQCDYVSKSTDLLSSGASVLLNYLKAHGGRYKIVVMMLTRPALKAVSRLARYIRIPHIIYAVNDVSEIPSLMDFILRRLLYVVR